MDIIDFRYSYIINNNSFSMDTRFERLTRLKMLSDKIENYASELSLSQESLDWALNCWSEYETLLNNKNEDFNEKNMLSQISIKSDSVLYERYVILKELLIARFEHNSNMIKKFGLEGSIPFKRDERIKKAFHFINTYENLVKEGMEEPLPSLMIENLKNLAIEAKYNLEKAQIERKDAILLTNELNSRFENDNVKIRTLYKWIVAFWGKKDPRLFDIGFTSLKNVIKGKSVNKVEGLKFDNAKNTFQWDNQENVEYYQLAKKVEKNGREWIEIYKGSENNFKFIFDDNCKIFKVRAYNEYGYGEWSENLNLDGKISKSKKQK